MSIALNPESDSMVGSAPLSGKQTPDLYHNTPHKSSAGFSLEGWILTQQDFHAAYVVPMNSIQQRSPSILKSIKTLTSEQAILPSQFFYSTLLLGLVLCSTFFTQSYSLTSTPQSMSIFRISVYPLLHAKDRALSLPLARRLGSAPCSEDVCTQKKVSVYSSYLYSIYQYALNEED